MRLFLIPVAYALPAVHEYFEAQPEDGSVLTPEDLRDLAQLVTRVLETSEVLISYAVALIGKPMTN